MSWDGHFQEEGKIASPRLDLVEERRGEESRGQVARALVMASRSLGSTSRSHRPSILEGAARGCSAVPARRSGNALQSSSEVSYKGAASKQAAGLGFKSNSFQLCKSSVSHSHTLHMPIVGVCAETEQIAKTQLLAGRESWLARTIPSDRSAPRISYRMKGPPRALRRFSR